MAKTFISLFAAVFFGLVATQTANAAGQYGQYGCPGQYGGDCPSQEVVINKTVKDPKSGSFVDTLENTDNKYTPGQKVTFKIVVTNTSADTIDKLMVQDVFPEFVSFEKGPGKFDKNTKTLSVEVTDLKPGAFKEILIEGKVADADKLPSNQGITCVVNQAQVTLDGKLSTDNAQFCIQKEVLSETKGGLKVHEAPDAKETPPTGPEAYSLLALLLSGTAGAMIRRIK